MQSRPFHHNCNPQPHRLPDKQQGQPTVNYQRKTASYELQAWHQPLVFISRSEAHSIYNSLTTTQNQQPFLRCELHRESRHHRNCRTRCQNMDFRHHAQPDTARKENRHLLNITQVHVDGQNREALERTQVDGFRCGSTCGRRILLLRRGGCVSGVRGCDADASEPKPGSGAGGSLHEAWMVLHCRPNLLFRMCAGCLRTMEIKFS